MKSSDLGLLCSVCAPSLHPDATRVVTAVSHPDPASDQNVGQLWNVPLDGTAPRRITRGVNDSNPAFSPDGSLIAFLRSGLGSPAQLQVMDAGGGEPIALTDCPLGVAGFRWSPASTHIAFSSAVPEYGRYGTVAGLTSAAEPGRRITTLKYKYNGLGYITDRRRQVFLVQVPATDSEPSYPHAPSAKDPWPPSHEDVPSARQLTFGDVDHSSPVFTPDGSTIAVIAAGHAERDNDLVSNIYEISLEEDDLKPRKASGINRRLGVSSLAYSAGGDLYFIATDLGSTGLDFVGRGDQLFVRDAEGSSPARQLTFPGTTETIASNGSRARFIDLGEIGSMLSLVDGGVLVQNRTRGRVELLRVGRDGAISAVVAGDVQVTGHDNTSPGRDAAFSAGGTSAGVTVVSFTSPASSGEIGLVEGATLRTLTRFSEPLQQSGIIIPDELVVTGRSGYPVHGWVLSPLGEGPHPVLLLIHGGPFAQWGVSVFDEAQVYVDAGYAVVMCNPRGAAGYGEMHARAIRLQLGTVDFEDVIDFLEGALAQYPSFDAGRLGILGGSYGGYLTAWTIAHDHRFAAAIVERGYLDPEAFIGTSDIGSFFTAEYAGSEPDTVRAQSPQTFVHQVTTPTFVIHSENDLRCPLGQGERFYSALLTNGTPAEMLIFPGENHELTRAGRPRHRVQRFDAVLQWWARYLPTSSNPNQEAAK